MIRRALVGLKDALAPAVVAALVAGLLLGQLAGPTLAPWLRPAVLPVLLLMLYPMLVTLDLREVLAVRRHLRPVGLSLLLNFAVAPLLAVGLARVFFAGAPAYAVGLYFVALVPTSGMTAAWTGLADGDLEAALVAVAVNLLVAVAVLPAYLSVLVPASVGIDATALYRQLAVVVVVPLVAGALTRRRLLARRGPDGFDRLKPVLGGLSSLGVVLIVLVAMTLRSRAILADPLTSLGTVLPLAALYAGLLAVGVLVGRAVLDPPQAVALVYATSMRNLSIALGVVVAAEGLPATAALPVALGYLLQPPLGAVYMHYRRDVVGEGRTLREALGAVVGATRRGGGS